MKQRSRNKYYQLFFNTLLFALGNVGSKFLIFLLMPLYTNKLSTAEYGVGELVITGTNLIIPIVSVSVQDATLRFTLDKKNNPGEVLKNTLLVVSVAACVVVLLSPLLKFYRAISEWSIYFVGIAVVYMFRNSIAIYTKAIGNTNIYAIDAVLYTLYLLVSNIVLLSGFELGLKGYFGAILISSALSIVQLGVMGKVAGSVIKSRVNVKLLKEMLLFSAPMIINSISWWVINSSDRIMVEHFLSASSSGLYSMAAKIPAIIVTIANIFNQAWIISSVTEYDNGKEPQFYSKVFKVFNCVLVITAACIVGIIKPFMKIYVGESFVDSWKYVPFLLLGSIFQAYAIFFGAIYTSAKKNVNVMVTTLIAAMINIGLNILLIPSMGIQGAVGATAIAYLVVFIFRMINSQRYVRFGINYWSTLSSMILLTVECWITVNVDKSFMYIIDAGVILCIVLINLETVKTLITTGEDKLKNLLRKRK